MHLHTYAQLEMLQANNNTGRWIAAGMALSLVLHYALLLSTTCRRRRRTGASAVVQGAAAALAYGVSAYITVALLAAMAAHEQIYMKGRSRSGGGDPSSSAVMVAEAPEEDAKYVGEYAMWAPLLLLQWGALDGVTAYSVEDAEMWRRQAMAGLVQLALAVYVVVLSFVSRSRSSKDMNVVGYYYVCSAALLAVGGMKCLERVMALRTASRSVISSSCIAIYEFMRLEAWLHSPLRSRIRTSSAHHHHHDPAAETAAEDHNSYGPIHYHYPVSGELVWYHRFLLLADDTTPEEEDDSRCLAAARLTPSLVTLHDLYSSPDLSHHSARPLLFTCVAFSLFKLFRRRLAGLYMYEWRQKWKTPHFFLGGHIIPIHRDLLSVLDMELRFLCDSIFSKFATLLGPAPAANMLLAFGRLFTTALFTASAVALLMDVRRSFRRPDLQAVTSGAAAEAEYIITDAVLVTWVLMASALAVEAYQLICLAFSDWTQVWLACTFIRIKDMVQNVDDRLQLSVEDDVNRADPYWVDGDRHEAAVPIITEEFRRRGAPTSTRAGIRRIKLVTQRWIGRCAAKLVLSTALRLSKSRAAGCGSGSRFCSRIGQSSLVSSWDRAAMNSSDGARRIWRCCRSSAPSYVDEPAAVDAFRQFVVRRVTEWCKEQYFYREEESAEEAAADVQNCAAFSSRWVWRVYRRMPEQHRPCLIAALGDSYTDFDHLLINWHIATAICYILEAGEGGGTTESNVGATALLTVAGDGERRRTDVVADEAAEVDVTSDGSDGGNGDEEVVEVTEMLPEVGKMLSEYMVYLLVHETELLPCHGEVARGLTEEVRRAMRGIPWEAEALRRMVVAEELQWEAEEEEEGEKRRRRRRSSGGGGGVAWRLAAGMHAARRLMELKEKWEVIVGVWVELLISAAASTRSETKEKAESHLRRNSLHGGGGGGELITQLWLLLAHMGFAEMQL